MRAGTCGSEGFLETLDLNDMQYGLWSACFSQAHRAVPPGRKSQSEEIVFVHLCVVFSQGEIIRTWPGARIKTPPSSRTWLFGAAVPGVLHFIRCRELPLNIRYANVDFQAGEGISPASAKYAAWDNSPIMARLW